MQVRESSFCDKVSLKQYAEKLQQKILLLRNFGKIHTKHSERKFQKHFPLKPYQIPFQANTPPLDINLIGFTQIICSPLKHVHHYDPMFSGQSLTKYSQELSSNTNSTQYLFLSSTAGQIQMPSRKIDNSREKVRFLQQFRVRNQITRSGFGMIFRERGSEPSREVDLA